MYNVDGSSAPMAATERACGAQPANTNALKSGTHSDALQQARRLAFLDGEGVMPEVPVSRAAWARLFDVNEKAITVAEIRLAKSLAQHDRLPFRGLPSLGPLARQRLAILNLLKRSATAGIAYGYALYQQADPRFFDHVRLLARDELRIARLEEKVVRDLEDAALRTSE